MSEFTIVDPIGADEVASLLGCSIRRVYQLDHLLRPITVRGAKVYSRESVLRYAADRDQRSALVRPGHNEITEHIAQLHMRVMYIESLDERHGPNVGRALEHAAISWAIELAEDEHPGLAANARERAKRITEQRARKRSLPL